MDEGQEVSRLAEIHKFVFAGLENQHARGAPTQAAARSSRLQLGLVLNDDSRIWI